MKKALLAVVLIAGFATAAHAGQQGFQFPPTADVRVEVLRTAAFLSCPYTTRSRYARK